MIADLMPVAASTVIPAVLLLAVAYVLRPQGGARSLRPRPVSVPEIRARLAGEPRDVWGGVRRPLMWTHPPAVEAAELMRDLGDTQQMEAVR